MCEFFQLCDFWLHSQMLSDDYNELYHRVILGGRKWNIIFQKSLPCDQVTYL